MICMLFLQYAHSQALTGPNGYKVIDLGDNGQGDYTQSLILLHEVYNGTLLPFNNAVGTITAYRGSTASFNRISVANINTTSAYNGTLGSVQSLSSDLPWKLKTCIYNGKKYMALDVPYSPAYHNGGFRFEGWNNSSGESLKCVNYTINGQSVNQNILSNIQDFNSNITETQGVQQMNVLGSVNVGTETANPDYLLQVKGKIRAQEIKVETANWPDYVFQKAYKLPSLKEVSTYIKKNSHLPAMPPEAEVAREGIDLGEMNKLLVKKVEELTLYLIEKDQRDKGQQVKLQEQQVRMESLEKKIKNLSKALKN